MTAKSLFLFGPRQTGKTSLIQQTLPDARFLSLLDSELFLSLSQRPSTLRELVLPTDKVVVIDELQRLPELLNEVHLLLESRNSHFLLTGSSARKLRRGGVNLLGGRARSRTLHPFVRAELRDRFHLRRALNTGLIPSIYLSEDPLDNLRAYAANYLREEIAAEGLTRNVPAFSRFLEVAAACNAQLINYTAIASDAQVPPSTVREYFQILEDTLLARRLPAWRRSHKRKAIATSKFYFFDIGVARFLQHRRGLRPRSPEFGEAFEAYIFHELSAYDDYVGTEGLAYWRSKSGFEVDFILGKNVAIEVKAKDHVGRRDLRGIEALMEEKLLRRYIVVTLEARPRRVGEIDLLPWELFLDQLWAGDLT
ncbi:MAG: ATP-binding protein [Deltaproteobacteria bacterium]|nr:ATP-binding protein [Deltaproteobacteria bacterium]